LAAGLWTSWVPLGCRLVLRAMNRCRFLMGAFAASTVLVLPAAAGADIGITRASPNSASQGQSGKVEIGCGWPKGCPTRIAVSLVPADKAPEDRPCDEISAGKLPPSIRLPANASCSPITRGPPHHRPYRFLGLARRANGSCGPWPARIVKCYELRFRVPRMSPGPYVFVAYVPLRQRRGRGGLLTSTRPRALLEVRPEGHSLGSNASNSLSSWLRALATAVAILTGE
jgi:hypothetical protein